MLTGQLFTFYLQLLMAWQKKRNPKGKGAGGSHGIMKEKSCDEHFI